MKHGWRPVMLLYALCGCTEQVARPPVQPLDAGTEELSGLYKWGPGPWSAAALPRFDIQRPERDGELNVRVYYPTPAPGPPNSPSSAGLRGPLPVLLFSHGNWSGNDRYDRLIEHWVSHGYIVVAPLHRDGNGSYIGGVVDMVRFGNLGLIQARVDDLVLVLDALPELAPRLPATVPPDLTRIAAAGHSFGAFNAQQLGGASAFDVDTQAWVPARDERIRAVVAISPPGPMFDEITEGSWQRLAVPTIMSTGTWDADAMFWPDWRLHRLSFETALAGDQYALVVQGADHYFGNLIGRLDREEPAQHDALALTNTVVVAFLDAYLRQNPAAREFLLSPQLETLTRGFATLAHR